MLIVDSSVGIDFFAGSEPPNVHRMDSALLSSEEIGVSDIVRLETLNGVRKDAILRKIAVKLNARCSHTPAPVA